MKHNLKLIISILFIIYIVYIASLPIISSSRIIIWALISLQIYTIYCIKKQFDCSNTERFHFEVSPEREKCLEEQVSLEQPPAVRSKGCCPVTHRGGNLKYVKEWKEKVWARPDMYVDTPCSNVYQTQLPPTGLFKEKEKKKEL